jgi:hypothetical protein
MGQPCEFQVPAEGDGAQDVRTLRAAREPAGQATAEAKPADLTAPLMASIESDLS